MGSSEVRPLPVLRAACLGLVLGLGLAGAWGAEPRAGGPATRMAVPLAAASPQIDGAVAPGEWDRASALTGFYSFDTGRVMEDGPVVFLNGSPSGLGLLFLIPMDPGRDLVTRVTERDGQVFTDDSVEIFLKAPGSDLCQVVVNAIGTVADYRNGSVLWNSATVARAGRVEGSALPAAWEFGGLSFWLVEAAIPWSDLGLASAGPGLVLAANLAVNRPTPWAVLAPCDGRSYAEADPFCELEVIPAESPRAQVLGLGRIGVGEVVLRARLINPGPEPVEVTLSLDLGTGDASAADKPPRPAPVEGNSRSGTAVVAPGSAEALRLELRAPDSAIDRIGFRATAGGEGAAILCRHAGPIRVAPPLQVRVHTVPSQGYAVIEVDSRGLTTRVAAATLQVRTEVSRAGGEVVLARADAVPLGAGELRLDCAGLTPGGYRVRLSAQHDGVEVGTAEAPFQIGDRPRWLSDPLYDGYAHADRVPLPWTPVERGERSVSVWGRSFTWDSTSLLPARIRSGAIEWLAGPLQVAGRRAGRDFTVPLGGLEFTEQRRARVTLTARGEAAGLAFTALMWVEYDGLLWITLSAEDRSGSGEPVEALRILAPMPAAQTTLYQTFARRLAGWVGTEPIPFAWIADAAGTTVNFYHWFGNERGGLGFVYTTLEHWQPLSPDRFCELRPGPVVSTYAANLIEAPTRIDGRSFVVGIQPTPVKPLPPDYHAMLAASVQFAPWKAWEQVPEAIDMTLVWPTPNGFAMQGLQDPYHVDGKIMADLVRRTQEEGLAFVGVASCPQKLSALDEWFAEYRLEWMAQPESQLAWDGIPHLQNCGRPRSLRQWLFHGWAVENVQRFGLDGIYFDGWQAGTMGCANPHHGCGWLDAQGRRQLTVPVLEGREFNHAMVLFLEDHVASPRVPARAGVARPGFPRYHYWIHSWEFVPPVMGFATEWLTGEFAGYPLSGPSMLTPEGTYGKCLGLGLFRSRALSTNWGIPNLFDTLMWENTENHPTDRQTLMAYAWFLPHGVPAGLIEYANQKTLVEVTRVLLAFGTRASRFTPCWEPNPYLTVQPDRPLEVLLATWDRPDAARMLAVVSNLNVSEPRQVVLQWQGPGLPTAVRDARTGAPVAMVDARLRVELGPESFALLWFDLRP